MRTVIRNRRSCAVAYARQYWSPADATAGGVWCGNCIPSLLCDDRVAPPHRFDRRIPYYRQELKRVPRWAYTDWEWGFRGDSECVMSSRIETEVFALEGDRWMVSCLPAALSIHHHWRAHLSGGAIFERRFLPTALTPRRHQAQKPFCKSGLAPVPAGRIRR